MKTKDLNKAKSFYNMKGVPSNVETCIIKLDSGNYIYVHLLSGNSKQSTRIFISATGEDKFMPNEGAWNYYRHVLKMPSNIQNGFLVGKEIAENYGKQLNKLPTVGSIFKT